jgi:hypothetical protein
LPRASSVGLPGIRCSDWPTVSSRSPSISSNCSICRSSFSEERPKVIRRSLASCALSFSISRAFSIIRQCRGVARRDHPNADARRQSIILQTADPAEE